MALEVDAAIDVLQGLGLYGPGIASGAHTTKNIGSPAANESTYPTTVADVFGGMSAEPPPRRWKVTYEPDEALASGWWETYADDRLRDWLKQLQGFGEPGRRTHEESFGGRREGLEPGCAWYQPIHFFGYKWGIYIRESCILQEALRIAAFGGLTFGAAAQEPPPSTVVRLLELLRASFYTIFLHEQFHHKVESFGFRLLVMGSTDRYRPYIKNVYGPTFRTKDCLEESLANADSYIRLTDSSYMSRIDPVLRKIVRQYLKHSFKLQPPGYAEATDYLTGPTFQAGLWQLQSQIFQGKHPGTIPAHHWWMAPDVFRSLAPVHRKIWMVGQPGTPPLFARASNPIR